MDTLKLNVSLAVNGEKKSPSGVDFDDFLGLLRKTEKVKPRSDGPSDNEIAKKIKEQKEANWVFLGDYLVLRKQTCLCCGSSTTYVSGVAHVERDTKSGTIRKAFNRAASYQYLAVDPTVEEETVPMCSACAIWSSDDELDKLFGQVFDSPKPQKELF